MPSSDEYFPRVFHPSDRCNLSILFPYESNCSNLGWFCCAFFAAGKYIEENLSPSLSNSVWKLLFFDIGWFSK